MTIAMSQLQQVTEGSGGTVTPADGVGGYLLKFQTGIDMFGALTELSQLDLKSEHVQVWSDRTVWIMPAGVTA